MLWTTVVIIPGFHCQRPEFEPWSGNQDPTSCMTWQKNVIDQISFDVFLTSLLLKTKNSSRHSIYKNITNEISWTINCVVGHTHRDQKMCKYRLFLKAKVHFPAVRFKTFFSICKILERNAGPGKMWGTGVGKCLLVCLFLGPKDNDCSLLPGNAEAFSIQFLKHNNCVCDLCYVFY